LEYRSPSCRSPRHHSGITFVRSIRLPSWRCQPRTKFSDPSSVERAGTIGRKKLFIGFSYQYFNFSTIDEQDTAKFQPYSSTNPSLQFHRRFPPAPPPSGQTKSERNQVRWRPMLRSRLYPNREQHRSEGPPIHQLLSPMESPASRFLRCYSIAERAHECHVPMPRLFPILSRPTAVGARATSGISSIPPIRRLRRNARRRAGAGQACLQASFSDSGTAIGYWPMWFFAESIRCTSEGAGAGVAVGVDVRLPPAIDQNFLGSGATGVKPFGSFSYKARISPHAEVGYEINGDSTLAGNNLVPSNTPPVAKGSLPNRFVYVGGSGMRFHQAPDRSIRYLWAAIVQTLRNFISQPYTDLGNCSGATNSEGVNCAVYAPGNHSFRHSPENCGCEYHQRIPGSEISRSQQLGSHWQRSPQVGQWWPGALGRCPWWEFLIVF